MIQAIYMKRIKHFQLESQVPPGESPREVHGILSNMWPSAKTEEDLCHPACGLCGLHRTDGHTDLPSRNATIIFSIRAFFCLFFGLIRRSQKNMRVKIRLNSNEGSWHALRAGK